MGLRNLFLLSRFLLPDVRTEEERSQWNLVLTKAGYRIPVAKPAQSSANKKANNSVKPKANKNNDRRGKKSVESCFGQSGMVAISAQSSVKPKANNSVKARTNKNNEIIHTGT